MARIAWLRAVHPVPALADQVAIPHSPVHIRLKAELTSLQASGQHVAVQGVESTLREGASAYPGDHRFFVDTTGGQEVRTGRDGKVLSIVAVSAAHWVYVLSRWPGNIWVVAGIDEIYPGGLG